MALRMRTSNYKQTNKQTDHGGDDVPEEALEVQQHDLHSPGGGHARGGGHAEHVAYVVAELLLGVRAHAVEVARGQECLRSVGGGARLANLMKAYYD